MKKALIFLYFFMMTILATWTYALAYLDPSSMTYMIQIIAGVAIAAGAGVGFYWKRIRRYFRRKKQERQQKKEAAAQNDENA